MTFKDFVRWCDERTCDGCWGMITALTCIDLVRTLRKVPFWKRERAWREKEKQVLEEIVNPVNQKIKELGYTN